MLMPLVNKVADAIDIQMKDVYLNPFHRLEALDNIATEAMEELKQPNLIAQLRIKAGNTHYWKYADMRTHVISKCKELKQREEKIAAAKAAQKKKGKRRGAH